METSGNSSKKQKLSNAPESWVSNVNVSGCRLRDIIIALLIQYSYSTTPRAMNNGVFDYDVSDPHYFNS